MDASPPRRHDAPGSHPRGSRSGDKGPEVLHPRTVELLKIWIFVMTLAWSRHAYAEVVTD